MKDAYPIILTKENDGYIVFVPDFNINTEGESITDSIEMARDAIGLMGIDMEDDGKPLPSPSKLEEIESDEKSSLVTLVDVDFSEYRLNNEAQAVRNRQVKGGK